MNRFWIRLRCALGADTQPRELRSRINHVTLTSTGLIRKQAGPKFSRLENQYDPRLLLQREVAFLERLDGRHAPRLIDAGDDWIEMEHCGVELSSANLPKDWREQAVGIVEALSEARIVHRDIKAGNVLVKEGKLYLIDFGWSIWADETPYLSPRELCEGVPREHIYDNRIALDWLLTSFIK